MNREEMLETVHERIAADPHWAGGMLIDARRLAEKVLDAILPQVTMVEELEALPKKSIVAAADGSTWFVDTWDDVLTSCCYQDEKSHAELLRIGPLTVVWQP